MKHDSGSGRRSMSDAWIPFHPAMDEPSKKWPDSNFSGPNDFTGTLTCCSLPRVSVKRRSTNLTSLSLINWNTSFAVIVLSSSHLIWLLSPVAVKKTLHSLPQTKKAFDLKNRSKTPLSSARHGSVPGYDFITQILWGPQGVRPLGTRSEERRVGKE